MTTVTPAAGTRGHVGVGTPDPETEIPIATDLLRRGVVAAPVAVMVGWLIRGGDGAASVLFALALVLANFVTSAAMLAWAVRISPALYLGAAFGGYFARLGLVTVAVLLVRDLSWVDLPAVGVTLVVAHLGLLTWELRSVSLTFAAPGLKPGPATVRHRAHEGVTQ